MSAKVFATFIAIGGSCVGVPLILWKEGKLGVSVSSKESIPASSATPTTEISETPTIFTSPETSVASSGSTTSLSSQDPESPSVEKATVSRPVVSRNLPNVQNAGSQRGNCDVFNLEKDYEEFLIGQGKNEIYVELSCENTNEHTSEGSFPHNWTGLFPEALFANGESFAVGQKFNLWNHTQTVDGKTKTTFKSSAFKNSSVTGTEGEGLTTKNSETVHTVVLDTGSEKSNTIYWISG